MKLFFGFLLLGVVKAIGHSVKASGYTIDLGGLILLDVLSLLAVILFVHDLYTTVHDWRKV